jgi:hypothetical protein
MYSIILYFLKSDCPFLATGLKQRNLNHSGTADVGCIVYKNSGTIVQDYEGVSKIFRTDAMKIINLTTKRALKLPSSTQLRAVWHTDSLDI